MTATGLSKIIEEFSYLPLEDKDYAIDIMKKQLIDAKRDALFRRTKQAETNFKKGAIKKGTVTDLYEDLENDKDSLG